MKNAKRAFATAISIIFTLAIFWTPITEWSFLVFPILAIPTAFAILRRLDIKDERGPRVIVKAGTYIWNRPLMIPIFMITALSTMTLAAYIVHMTNVGNQVTSPMESIPWQKELPARVYWNGQPNPDMQQGFASTAKLLGFRYEEATTAEEANIQIWPNSWMHMCKWLETSAFVSLDPDPSPQGAQTADIYICRFTLPWNKKIHTDYSVMAHETAHVLAAIGHFGEGLMAKKGGDGPPWFSNADIKELCEKITEFHNSVDPITQDPNKESGQITAEDDGGWAQCGSERIPP